MKMTAYRGWGIQLAGGRIFVNSEALADKVAFETYRLLDRTLEAIATAGFGPVGPALSFGEMVDARVELLRPIDVGITAPGSVTAQLGLLHSRRDLHSDRHQPNANS